MLHKIHLETKVNANVRNVELVHYSNKCQKEKMTFIRWGENKEDDLESITSFNSVMNSVYSENDNRSSESDT